MAFKSIRLVRPIILDITAPCFSLESSLSDHFLAEKARLLEICWETWLQKALDQSDPLFWTSKHPERPAKEEHEDSTEKIQKKPDCWKSVGKNGIKKHLINLTPHFGPHSTLNAQQTNNMKTPLRKFPVFP